MSRTELSYARGPAQQPLIQKTIGDMFDDTTSRFPDQEALVSRHQHLSLTYNQLKLQVDRLALSLLAFGVEKDDRVGIWSPNNTE